MKGIVIPELLAPCGSWESLQAAIQAGCNSIYFGIEHLNMRSCSSINFTLDDLERISAISGEHGVKTCLTLNTVMYDHDLSLMRSIVDAAKKCRIDAIIASDVAVMNYARKRGMPVHISTQANITNIDSVQFYSMFADVVVLARELTLIQVESIVKDIDRGNITGPSGKKIQVEIFAHGALCMAVSGKCYLSLHSDFASANRGACVQNCRRNYIVIDKESGNELEVSNEYIMSAKDLCTIDFLDRLVNSGVSVIKIEGRGRSEDYVYTTTKCYREALDSISAGTYSDEKLKVWKENLSRVFNRGFWDGYYLGRKMGEWNDSYGSKATTKKVYVAKGVKYFSGIGVAEFKMESQTLKVGDEFLVSGPTTGVLQDTVHELRMEEIQCGQVKKGDVFSMPVKSKIRPSDKLYKLVRS